MAGKQIALQCLLSLFATKNTRDQEDRVRYDEMISDDHLNVPGSPETHDEYLTVDHLHSDLAGRSARGGAVTVSAQLCKFLIGTVGTIVLARLLSPQDYGLVGMVAIVVSFLSMFQYLGLSTATIQWAKITHRQVTSLFWINLGLSLGVALVTAASAPLLAWFYKDPRLVWITVGYAATIILSGLGIQHEALLNRQMRFTAIAVVEVAAMVLGLVVAMVAAWHGAGYWALVLNQAVMFSVIVVGMWATCGWRPGLPARDPTVRSMLSFGGNLTGFNVLVFFARNLDNALIGKFWGPYQLGLYAKAYQLLLLPMQQINGPFGMVAIPTLSRLADAPKRYREAYLKYVEQIALITMPLVVFMIGTSDWLVVFLLGEQWRETSRIFVLLGIAAFIQPVSTTTAWLFTTQDRTRDLLHWGLVRAAIAIISIVVGLRWGALGVAAAYGFSDVFICTPILFWYVGRKGPVRSSDFYKAIVAPGGASLCGLVALMCCRPWLETHKHLSVRLLLGVILTLAVSLIILAAVPAGRRAIRSSTETLLLMIKWKNRSTA